MHVDVTSFGVELQDLFAGADGRRVRDAGDWPRRRAELAAILQAECYGQLPPVPDRAPDCERIIDYRPRELDGLRYTEHRVWPLASVCLTVQVYRPPEGAGPFPTILDGDGCWRCATSDAMLRRVTGRGYALVVFNRCEVLPDVPAPGRISRFERLFPDGDFGAIAGWAWGFHRVLDALPAFEGLDPARIAVAGHSRGGKAALLAGALDARIALVSANASGSGGGGCWRFQGTGAEPLEHMLRVFPTWFGTAFAKYRGRQGALPFDQHFLKALCAPRPLLCSESLDDLWANPVGTCLSHRAAREAYRLYGVPEARLGLTFRSGPHAHAIEDWDALLDFCDLQFFGKPAPRDFLREPFDNLPTAFSWRSPAARPD